MRALVLHAYSASNLGDGLLVRETLELVREACGGKVDITVLASHPETFTGLNVKVLNSAPTKRGFNLKYLKTLWRMDGFDLVVAVGGGYIRAGTVVEALKAGVIHGPQLVAAALRTRKAVYLPQSVGPARFGTRPIMSALLSRQHAVWVRDNRSQGQFPLQNVQRTPDLAILGMQRSTLPFDSSGNIVLSVRYIRGALTQPLRSLHGLLGVVDSYVQSSVASNNDVPAVNELAPQRILSTNEFMENPDKAKVVIAVRLHAALMAIAAGHYVIHLAYERKGFGAFQDLGIPEFVFNVNSFDAEAVAALAYRLQTDVDFRTDYHSRVLSTRSSSDAHQADILASLQESMSAQLVQ
ncbi:hypothetical protein AS189_16425 [Arthrobacter alpinus]|uniref:Polysaccharide pyruvyl transferase domain-containing protein n=2 Tax=Arthrobacter alpinus TaxID=656366 RepID=A0A0S2M2A8_9MICC|nr:hypothetical protein AS189_16425 [Arthrobacter alpinus]